MKFHKTNTIHKWNLNSTVPQSVRCCVYLISSFPFPGLLLHQQEHRSRQWVHAPLQHLYYIAYTHTVIIMIQIQFLYVTYRPVFIYTFYGPRTELFTVFNFFFFVRFIYPFLERAPLPLCKNWWGESPPLTHTSDVAARKRTRQSV